MERESLINLLGYREPDNNFIEAENLLEELKIEEFKIAIDKFSIEELRNRLR